MKPKINLLRLNRWRERQLSVDIKIEDILIKESIHIDSKTLKLDKKKNKLAYYIGGRPVPVVVQEQGDKYILLFGLKILKLSELLDKKMVSAIVVKNNRDELIHEIEETPINNIYYLDINDIRISSTFAKTKPSSHKFARKKKEIEEGKVSAIEVDSSTNILTDGYITYLILKEKGVKDVLVENTDNNLKDVI